MSCLNLEEAYKMANVFTSFLGVSGLSNICPLFGHTPALNEKVSAGFCSSMQLHKELSITYIE